MFDIKKELIKSIFPSAIACTVMSFLVNYFLIPMPKNVMANAIGNGVSGLLSGIITAAIVTILLVKTANKEISSKK